MAEMVITTEPSGPVAPQQATTATPGVEQQAAPQKPVATPENEKLTTPAENMPAPEPASNEPPPDATDEAVSNFVQEAGLDPVALSREIATKGDISPEAKTALGAKLEKAGLPPALVDEYITGQKAVMDKAVQEIMSVAGGEDGYKEMAEWASQNLSEAELKAYADIMTRADINTAKLTVGNLNARFRAAVPQPGKYVKATTGIVLNDTYQSWEQQKEAQRDPRYQTDPAYRKEVAKKVERTLKAGGYRQRS